jgi:NTP pyrophosphatase (non-canonical NTP hydrolase)
LTARTASVLAEVARERERQHAKWGVQNFPPELWLMVLGEEVGEVNNAALEHHVGNLPDLSAYREELIQVAAVAVQAVESLDRQAEGEGERGEG